MKNLFKKTSASTNDENPNHTPSKTRFSGQVTPPVTPSPTKQSNLSVRVIPSQREFSTPEPQSPQTLAIPDDESTLLTAVLGMGCGSPLFDGVGSSLAPIPEENMEVRTEWGKPPSVEDDSEEESVNHDDFEVVLQNEDLGPGAVLGLSSHNGPHNYRDVPLFCQPCEAASQNAIPSVASNEKPKRRQKRFKLPKMKRKSKSNKSRTGTSRESKTSKKKKQNGDEHVSSPTQSPIRKSSRHIASVSPASPRKVQIGKLFHSRSHKKKSMQGNAQVPPESTSSKGSSHEHKSSKRGRWKCVHDQKLDKVYFYHTVTREVTWRRPPEFVEWRIAHDANKRKFFYNVITKETSWDTPDGFEEWKEAKDQKSGKVYYYNIFTKKTTWEKPTKLDNMSSQAVDAKKSEETISFETNALTSEELGYTHNAPDHVVLVSGQQEDELDNDLKQAEDAQSPETVSETPQIPWKETGDQYRIGLSHDEEPPKIAKCDGQERLAKLLSTFCPDEEENNSQLLNKCREKEAPIIKGIEALVEDTPFDELRLAIFSYVKTTLREMGEEPFDERKSIRKSRRPPVTQNPPKNMNRVASTAGYSLGSRALSHVTGRSGFTNVTEQTNRINNTSNRTLNPSDTNPDPKDALAALNERWNNMSLNNSFDEMTDATDEDVGEVLLDMKVMQTENSLRPNSSKGNIDFNSRRASDMDHITDKKIVVNENFNAKDATENGYVNNLETISNPSQDADTLESAYAADEDDETDHCEWDEEIVDDVSALSDSFGPSITKRYLKEKSSQIMQEESQKDKVRLQ